MFKKRIISPFNYSKWVEQIQNIYTVFKGDRHFKQKTMNCVKTSENDTVKPLWHRHFYQNLIIPLFTSQ